MVLRKETINRRIEMLKRYLVDLDALIGDVEFLSYKRDIMRKYAVERLCHVISEAILDCLEHLLVTKYKINPVSYRDVLDSSYERGILSEELYKGLQGIAGFRNVLVHRYVEIDDEVVYTGAKRFIVVLPEVITQLEAIGK